MKLHGEIAKLSTLRAARYFRVRENVWRIFFALRANCCNSSHYAFRFAFTLTFVAHRSGMGMTEVSL